MWLHGLIAPSDYKETPMPFSKPPNPFLPYPNFRLSQNHLENITVE
jgi:hypothetical protein